MPEISRFFGIRIEMFYDDHLPPHFHARYEGGRAAFALDGELMQGVEWAALHPGELLENWRLAENHLSLKPIPPLS